MKNVFLLVLILATITSSAQLSKRDLIPMEQLQQAADRFANQKWGNVGAAQATPYYDAYENIVAYSFTYALGKDFSENETRFSENELDENGIAKVERWGNGKYANLVMGNNRIRISMIRYINSLSEEYAYQDLIVEMATKALGSTPVADKVYYYNPLLKYYKYDLDGSSVYVRIFPPRKVLSPAEFQEEYTAIFNTEEILPKAEPGAWEYYLGETNSLKSVNAPVYIAHHEVMPYLDWSYGCSPTSGGMILGYWDNYSQYSSNDYGNLVKYHFHRSDAVQGDEDYNVSNAQQWCATYMNTDLSNGNSSEGDIGPGMRDAANSAHCGSYNFTQWTSSSYSVGSNTTKLNLFKGEVDNNRPSVTSIPGHSVACVGYDVQGANTFMVVHNTWNEGLDDHWNYTQIDRLIFLYPGGQYGTHLKLTSPIGDPAYNHNGNGEDIFAGNVWEITWNYEFLTGSYCKLYYSTNAGSTWTTITSNTPNDGTYLWTTPNTSTSQGRVKVEVYSSGGVLQASDGSWGNFSLVTGGSIITLNSDVSVATSVDPTYYKLNHTSTTWGIAGIRTNNLNTNNWSMRFYSSDNFATEVEASTWATNVDFVVFDQHHLSTAMRGIKTYIAGGTGTAQTEFEGFTETLALNTPQVHVWPANDVVEIWDVYLAPGTYKFTMNYNSGSANLDMALFSSYGGPYYQNREDYLAHSTRSGTLNESFFATVPAYDYYGFVVWANDANAANVTITVEPTVAGLWEGDVSSDWNTAGNWNDNNVPTSTTDVVIPSGTTYSPYVNTADANARKVTVQSGATLTIGNSDLYVEDEVHIYGTVAMNHINADFICYGDIYWESGSQANLTADGEFRISGDWNFEAGANVQLTTGNTWFLGTSTAYIRCHEANCSFYDVLSNKSGGAIMGVSYQSSEDLSINGSVTIYSGSAFNSYSQEKILIDGSFNNSGGHFLCNFGTIEFTGTPLVSLKPNVGDYFNKLIVNTSSTLNLINTYSDSLVIKDELSIQSGTLNSNGNTITIAGDWLNYVGESGFTESTGKVIFNGTSTLQYCYGETFHDVTKTSDAAFLHFYGPTYINNNFYCYGNAWANELMLIQNLYLNLLGKFSANSNGSVTIGLLDMGLTIFSLNLYGTIVANGGQITVNDLAEDGLYGTFRVYGATGLLDVTQDASTYIDLKGNIEISNGTMNVRGGSSDSYWPYLANASITMSGGVLDFIDVGILINVGGSYSLTTNITGGTIRTDNNFSVNESFNPAGGTVEIYGSNYSYVNMYAANAALYNLHINKTSNTANFNTDHFYVSNDFTLDGGTVISPDTFYIGGDWTNNAGASAFNEGANVVTFYGPASSNITTNETFYKLDVDKTYSSFDGLVQLTGLTVTVGGNMHIMDGTFEMDASTITDIGGNLLIENGGGFNANDSYTSVFLAGNLTDYNTTNSTTNGLAVMSQYNDWTFDGNLTQNFDVSSTSVEFGNLIINKPSSTAVQFYDDFRVNGDVSVISGNFEDGFSNLNFYLEGDLNVNPSGSMYPTTSTTHFEGNSPQYFNDNGPGYYGNVVINSSDMNSGLHLNADLIILGNKDLTVTSGHLWANGNLIRVVGNIYISSDGEMNMDDDSELNIGSTGHLNINSGGVLELIGSAGHEVVIESNDATYWQFNCYSGGTISAEWASFEDLDTWGVYIFSGGVVDASHSFNHCTFLPGEAGGSLLWVENSQTFTVEHANFPSQGSSSYNARKNTASGQVTFLNYQGSFAGEAFDYDPNNNVIWTINLDVNAAVTDVSCYGGNNGAIDITVTGGTPGYTYLWNNGSTQGDRTNLTAGIYSLTTTDSNGITDVSTWTIYQPAVYTVASNYHTDVSCHGGSNGYQSIMLYGGTPPDVFLWSNGATDYYISNVPAGTYTLTCTDYNGCVATGSYIITQPPALNLVFTSTNVGCFSGSDGAIDLTVSGGTAPYTYNWTGGATTQDRSSLAPGNYTVTVTDFNGCTATGFRTISQPLAISITGSITHVTLIGGSNGSVAASATGGTPPYSYSWGGGQTNSTISGLSAGTYVLTVMDSNGCGNVQSFTVNDGTGSTLAVSGVASHVNCYGQSTGAIDITVTGGTAPYSYHWNNGSTLGDRSNLVAGAYSLTVTDAMGSTATGSWTITQPVSALALSFTSTNVSCFGGNNGTIDLTVSGGTSPYTYNWTGGATTQDRSSLASSNYTVTVTDFNGCTATGFRTITQPVNLIITYTKTDVTTSGGSNGAIDITVTGGSPGYSYSWSNGATNQDLTGLSAGFYYVTVSDLNGCLAYETIEITEPGGLDVQNISLPIGWSLMSTYINPVNPSTSVVFSPVVASLSIVKNGSGAVYWPTFSVNSIGNMVLGQGYQVKMTSAQILPVSGTAAVPELTPLAVPVGWSIIGYLRQVPGNVVTMMSPIVGNISLMKNGSGAVYWPSFGVNAIGNMVSGQGYQIRLNASSTLTYPANASPSSKANFEIMVPEYYKQPAATGNNMTVGIPTSSFETLPMIGDEVGAFSQDGQLVGAAIFAGENMAIPVWGDDDLSIERDGLQTGHELTFRIWDGQSEKLLSVEKWTEGNGLYTKDDIQVVGKFRFVSMDITTFRLDQNVPNPFKASTKISFFLPEDSDVSLKVFDILGNEIELLTSGKFPAGEHTVEVDGQKYATGNYFYRLIANNFVETKQMEVAR